MAQKQPALVKQVSDLRVFQLAYEVSLGIHRLTDHFPKSERYDLTSQMRRASKSICANLAEGYEKQQFSKAEFRRFLTLSIGSCAEMKVWVKYAHDLGYIQDSQATQWLESYHSILRMLQSLHRNTSVTTSIPVIRSSDHPVIQPLEG